MTCPNCDAPIQEGQQWCLQCGAAQPGSLGGRPAWRPLAAVALVSVALVAAAAVAAAAALDKHNTAHHVVVIAQVPAAGTASTPSTTTPGATPTPAAPGTKTASPGGTTSKTPTTPNPLFPPASASKPPKIPAPATTPEPSGSTGTGSTGSSGTTTTTPSETGTSTTNTTTTESKSTGSGNAEPPSPILLDTNAATTYDPYNYPESEFGDPALAIDGETSTAWTAKVNPTVAPRMAEGLLIDLRSPTKLGSVEIRTDTPGMTVQLFGASASKAPAAITDPGWTPLHASRVLKKDTKLKLNTGGRPFRFLVVWIVKAPASSTAQAPGHVSLNEVVLFGPAS